jgi:hypothetical protein
MFQEVYIWFMCLACAMLPLDNRFLIQDHMEVFVLGPPLQKAVWPDAPSVRVCAETGISMYRLAKALLYWEILGYEFKKIQVDHAIVCAAPRADEIVFSLPDGTFDNSRIASTSLYTHIKTNDIIMAQIHIFPRSHKKDRVLEHEIGHALGWSHYNQKFHIMHSNWFLGGHDSKGLRK